MHSETNDQFAQRIRARRHRENLAALAEEITRYMAGLAVPEVYVTRPGPLPPPTVLPILKPELA